MAAMMGRPRTDHRLARSLPFRMARHRRSRAVPATGPTGLFDRPVQGHAVLRIGLGAVLLPGRARAWIRPIASQHRPDQRHNIGGGARYV